jgi:hypothetical protein
MDTPLVIDNEETLRLASALTELTGESLTASIVAALHERLARERASRQRTAGQALTRAIAANVRQESRHLARIPDHGWCQTVGGGLPR